MVLGRPKVPHNSAVNPLPGVQSKSMDVEAPVVPSHAFQAMKS
jgi:hypothetical protein